MDLNERRLLTRTTHFWTLFLIIWLKLKVCVCLAMTSSNANSNWIDPSARPVAQIEHGMNEFLSKVLQGKNVFPALIKSIRSDYYKICQNVAQGPTRWTVLEKLFYSSSENWLTEWNKTRFSGSHFNIESTLVIITSLRIHDNLLAVKSSKCCLNF